MTYVSLLKKNRFLEIMLFAVIRLKRNSAAIQMTCSLLFNCLFSVLKSFPSSSALKGTIL